MLPADSGPTSGQSWAQQTRWHIGLKVFKKGEMLQGSKEDTAGDAGSLNELEME